MKHFFQKICQKVELLAEGGGQPNLKVVKVKATLIQLPQLEEQKAIVERFIMAMNLCDSLEGHTTNNRTKINQLEQSFFREVYEDKTCRFGFLQKHIIQN
ncbi:MAG: restriction endonuclease subunit S [Flagellimonas sp.]